MEGRAEGFLIINTKNESLIPDPLAKVFGLGMAGKDFSDVG